MHASEYDLALYAGGEMGIWARRRVAWHLGECPQCRARYEEFLAARRQLQENRQQLPAGVDWERLAAEMTANIHLGLAAGKIVARPAEPAHLTGWRPALVFASALLVVLLAWWVNTPVAHVPQWGVAQQPVMPPGVSLEVNAAGIGLNDHGRVLTLMHPQEGAVTYSVSLQGSARARYVDSESGQVTINNVYVQ
ncbi:MAG: hypothetical protein HY235_16950 [Acidobacteria bacterium]|nr:hypothetical protein [Acidobacteriota bacterium]